MINKFWKFINIHALVYFATLSSIRQILSVYSPAAVGLEDEAFIGAVTPKYTLFLLSLLLNLVAGLQLL